MDDLEDGWNRDGVSEVVPVAFLGDRVAVLDPAAVAVSPGEHWCVALTRALGRSGLRLGLAPAEGPLVHPYAAVGGRLAVWCEVVPVAGAAAGYGLADPATPEHRRVAELRARGVDDATWSRDSVRLLEEHYLLAPTPEGQSGKSGDAADWELARRVVVRPVHRDGTFLDLGCANGLLMESVVRWAAEDGLRLEPYGLDASERLAALARTRLPQWRDRIFVGDALTWTPPRRFDFVHTMVDLVPARRRPGWLARVLREVVAPGGRLIVRDSAGIGEVLRGWGLPVAGIAVQERGDRPAVEAAWMEAPG